MDAKVCGTAVPGEVEAFDAVGVAVSDGIVGGAETTGTTGTPGTAGTSAGADPCGSRPGRASRSSDTGGGPGGALLDGGEPCATASVRRSVPTSGDAAVAPSVTSAGTGRGTRASTGTATAGSARRAWDIQDGVTTSGIDGESCGESGAGESDGVA